MEQVKNYFSGEWYKKKSFSIAVAVIVVVIAVICVVCFMSGGEKEYSAPVSAVTYEQAKEHYGVYSEETAGLYSCKDINGNLLTGYRLKVRAEMKKGMTKEEIYNDAIAIDAEGGAVETEIHFIYKLDNSYNVTVNVCKGELFVVSMEGRKFITKEDWLASFESEAA